MSFNRNLRVVVLDDGTRLPITNWIDEDGDDCQPEDAVTCVAGSDEHGWLAIDLSELEVFRVH